MIFAPFEPRYSRELNDTNFVSKTTNKHFYVYQTQKTVITHLSIFYNFFLLNHHFNTLNDVQFQ
jgi:hypothetical protein